jgi:hypothetical protein
MVVIATPQPHPEVQCCEPDLHPTVLSPVACAGQNVLSAPVSAVNGTPVLSRMRAISVTQGQCATIDWQMHDRDGHPVNLTPCGFVTTESETVAPENFKVVLRLKEHLALGNARTPVEVDAVVIDAPVGKVQAQLTANMVGLPGVYYGEMALVSVPAQAADLPCVVFSNTFFVVIVRGTFGDDGVSTQGPPSIAEIRLHLRDSSPSESFLLDNLMFDDAEIALAIARPVQYWNETPPFLDAVFTTQTFPWRYHWLEGICANLFFMVAEQFRRNQLSYSAAGVTLDDQNKEPNYERAGQARWQTYREWVRATKAAINLEGGYGVVGSPYKYGAYTSGLRLRY